MRHLAVTERFIHRALVMEDDTVLTNSLRAKCVCYFGQDSQQPVPLSCCHAATP
jgi:hypothetical protein